MENRLTQAQDFIWKYARLLERQEFAYSFRGGPKLLVLSALRAYQNADGGFGNALEPDKRNLESQPVDVEVGLQVLDRMDAFDDPMIGQVCNFLETITTPEGGLPFALPSVKKYPRAPWWEADENPPASLNPTASIAGLLLKHQIDHPWVRRAEAYCWQAITATETTEFHDVMPIVTFLEHAPDRRRAKTELERVAKRVNMANVVSLDPNASGYAQSPLDWAPTPDRSLRGLFSDAVIQAHLQALAAKQQPDGGWPINWTPVSVAVEYEWRGIRTIAALQTLKAYGAALE